ncbi:hypothetical protein GCM10010528_29890 [Gordonia defluvii]|uniref:Uncharacterized protein n=2 Tax=Gordoniaceae TaxID=85026 RepID=A0ABP6LL70_9ACTN
MQRMRRIVATALATAAIASGAVAVGASPAQAAIRPGDYTYTVWGEAGHKILTSPAIVRGNRIYLADEETWYEVTPTRRGGYLTAGTINRRDFWQVGNGYAGISYLWVLPRHPSVTARITLTPR